MTKKSRVHVPAPCHIRWDEMRGDDRSRLCDTCDTPVHNLSDMTRAEAEALLEERSEEHLCVHYLALDDGEALYRDSTHPAWRLHRQLEGARRLLAAALTLPLLAACEPAEPTSRPIAEEPTPERAPIRIGEDGSITTPEPGAGLAPAPPTLQEPTPSPPLTDDREPLAEPLDVRPVVGTHQKPDDHPTPALEPKPRQKVGKIEQVVGKPGPEGL